MRSYITPFTDANLATVLLPFLVINCSNLSGGNSAETFRRRHLLSDANTIIKLIALGAVTFFHRCFLALVDNKNSFTVLLRVESATL